MYSADACRTKDIEQWFISDEQFNELYPPTVQELAARHWTPLDVARRAADFFSADPNARVLDIGSGVGKFCLAAAHYNPGVRYFGIEQRANLVGFAEDAKARLGMDRVHFHHGNFTQLDLTRYDHFYFYNSFYENLDRTDKIDHSIVYSGELYRYYTRYLCIQLNNKPKGTKLVSFHSLEDEIPVSFRLERREMDGLLKFWIKTV